MYFTGHGFVGGIPLDKEQIMGYKTLYKYIIQGAEKVSQLLGKHLEKLIRFEFFLSIDMCYSGSAIDAIIEYLKEIQVVH